MQKTIVIGLATGLVLVGAALFWASKQSHPCWQETGEGVAFDVTISENSHPDLDRIIKVQTTNFSGNLYLKSSGNQGFLRGFSNPPLVLQGRFLPRTFQSSDQTFTQFRDFQKPFLLHFDQTCKLSKIDFDGQETFSARQTVFRLLRILDIPKSGIYQDFLGSSELTAVRTIPGQQEYHRLGILKAKPSPQLKELVQLAAIDASTFTFTFAGRTWPELVEVSEQLKLKLGLERNLQELSYQIRIKKLDSFTPGEAFDGNMTIDPHFKVSKAPADELRGKDRASVYANAVNTQVSVNFAAAIGTFKGLLNSDPIKAKYQLLEFLYQNPTAVGELEAGIRQLTYSDSELVHLLFVFAKLDRPEGQAALTHLIEDQSLSPSIRIRALFAVGEVVAPGEGLIQSVRSEADSLRGTVGNLSDAGATALLASGIIARNLNDVAPESHAAIIKDIQDIYQSAAGDSLRAAAIDAMGNSEDGIFFDAIKAGLDAGSDSERHAAIEAISKVPGEDRDALLASKLSSEKNPNNRIASYQALQTIGIRSAPSLAKVEAQLKLETDPGVRTAAMHALGISANIFPESRKVLMEQAKSETNPDVLQAAGRYLSAFEMKK